MRYNRIIMFCDYGLDDAIATLHILKHADMFKCIDIVPIGGNVNAAVAFRNAHTLLAAANADTKKVRLIDARAIAQPGTDIPDVHGVDGIGDVLPPAESSVPVIGFEEFQSELETVREPSRDCVLSLGPCTLPVKLGYVPFCTALMGGTVNEPPNYGEYEFNEGMDVEAFKKLAYAATAVATLDTCHDEKVSYDDICPGDALTAKLTEKYKSMCVSRNAPVTVYDYVAAKAVTDPELFDVERIKRADGVEFNQLKIRK